MYVVELAFLAIQLFANTLGYHPIALKLPIKEESQDYEPQHLAGQVKVSLGRSLLTAAALATIRPERPLRALHVNAAST